MVLRWHFLVLWLALSAFGGVRAELVISEFMARNVTSVADSKGVFADWIELHNAGLDPVDLGGWYLTDSPTNLTQWRLPTQFLAGDSYVLVFASGKNTTTAGSPLHTNFKLASSGGYLALVQPDGQTVAAEFLDYPPQAVDVSYGLAANAPGIGVFLNSPTPRSANSPGSSVRAGEVTLSAPGGLFATPFSLTLATTQSDGVIRYTLDGTTPSETAPLYSAPFTIERTLRVRTRVFAPGHVPGPVGGAAYTLVGPTAKVRSSNLPIVVLDTYGSSIVADSRTKGTITILQPANGRTTLPGTVNAHSRATFEVRGSSSTGFPKQSYGLELRGEDDADRDVSLLGLPAESDWVLYAPYSDKTLIRNVLVYELSNQLGRYAPRTRLVELYVNRTGALDAPDYQGVYVLIEKIKGGWTDVDVIITTPSVMGQVGALGRILGPRGLMPNPKTGTVTMDVGKAVTEKKAGNIDFKVDKAGIVHASIGRVSFDADKLAENASELIQTLVKLKPSAAKGTYIQSISVSSTMSPGVNVETRGVAH